MNILEIYKTMEYGTSVVNQKPAMIWLETKKQQLELFIDGQWRPPQEKNYSDNYNPTTGDFLTKIAKAKQNDIDAAVTVAKKAQPLWWKLNHHMRAQFLSALAKQIQKRTDLFSLLETLSSGVTINTVRSINLPLVNRLFYHYASWPHLMRTELHDCRPVGVVGQIISGGPPLLSLIRKVVPALAMGNSVVLKPAPSSSIIAVAFAEICQETGLPPGVLNIVTGDQETEDCLLANGDFDQISFTGSVESGRLLREKSAETGRKLTLEIEDKPTFIVFEDADLDSAVEGIMEQINFQRAGIVLTNLRLLVQEGIKEQLVAKIKVRIEKIRTGNPLDKTVDISLIGSGKSDQAREIKKNRMNIAGTDLIAVSFRTQQEAVKVAGSSRFGSVITLWTENINLALKVASKVKVGTIKINAIDTLASVSAFDVILDYVKPKWTKEFKNVPLLPKTTKKIKSIPKIVPPIASYTTKLYIGGKQVHSVEGGSVPFYSAQAKQICEITVGGRQDIQNAVKAANTALKWRSTTAYNRGQVLYSLAENLAVKAEEFVLRISLVTGNSQAEATKEVTLSIERLFIYAGLADKAGGGVRQMSQHEITLAVREPLGIVGVICPNESPLLGFISTVIPPLSVGNVVVAVPSARYSLLVTDFYQILDMTEIPDGILNIITGDQLELAKVLAKDKNVDGIWYFGTEEGSRQVEYESSVNLKHVWLNHGLYRDWKNDQHSVGEQFLRESTKTKNIWLPYA